MYRKLEIYSNSNIMDKNARRHDILVSANILLITAMLSSLISLWYDITFFTVVMSLYNVQVTILGWSGTTCDLISISSDNEEHNNYKYITVGIVVLNIIYVIVTAILRNKALLFIQASTVVAVFMIIATLHIDNIEPGRLKVSCGYNSKLFLFWTQSFLGLFGIQLIAMVNYSSIKFVTFVISLASFLLGVYGVALFIKYIKYKEEYSTSTVVIIDGETVDTKKYGVIISIASTVTIFDRETLSPYARVLVGSSDIKIGEFDIKMDNYKDFVIS